MLSTGGASTQDLIAKHYNIRVRLRRAECGRLLHLQTNGTGCIDSIHPMPIVTARVSRDWSVIS